MAQFFEAAKGGPSEALKFVESRIPPAQQEEWDKFYNRQHCIVRAAAKPLPGASGDAFISGPIRIADKVVKRITPCIWLLLQAVNSPILKMFEDAISTGKSNFDWKPPQMWDACWIFTEDSERLETLMESSGPAAISAEAKQVVGKTWEESQIEPIMGAIIEQVFRHAQTKVRYIKEATERGDVRFFREAALSSKP